MKKFQFKKILIIKHGSLGDVISATSIIKAINDKYNSADISVLTSTSYSTFFSKINKNFNIYIDDRKGFFKTLKMLLFFNKKKFDLIIDLQNSNRTFFYNIFFKFISKSIINSTHRFSDYRYKYSKLNPPAVIQGLVNQVKLINVEPNNKPYLNFLEKDLTRDFHFLDKLFFIIHPGCSIKNLHRKWSDENYIEVCKHLLRKNVIPVITGAETDRKSVEKIIKNVPESINLLNKSPLDVIYNLSIRACGAISNDTGPAHLIASTGCKIHLVLSSKSKANTQIPQSNNVTFSQSDNHINDIKTEKVLIFIDKILND